MNKKYTCAFTGYRKDKLERCDVNNIFDITYSLIKNLYNQFGVNKFIYGGATGFDTISALAVLKLKRNYSDIKGILAIPFKDQCKFWSDNDLQLYNDIIEQSDEVVYVDRTNSYMTKPYDVYINEKYHKRNKYMIDKSKIVISCSDMSFTLRSGTHSAMRYTMKRGKNIYNINPYTLNIDYIKAKEVKVNKQNIL